MWHVPTTDEEGTVPGLTSTRAAGPLILCIMIMLPPGARNEEESGSRARTSCFARTSVGRRTNTGARGRSTEGGQGGRRAGSARRSRRTLSTEIQTRILYMHLNIDVYRAPESAGASGDFRSLEGSQHPRAVRRKGGQRAKDMGVTGRILILNA
jgi:hypothetical protein